MIEQLPLPLDARPPAADPGGRETQLVGRLRGMGWVPSRRLHGLMPGWGSLEAFQRLVREIAEASDGRIITGQRGYCLIEEAQPSDRYHSGRWLISQGRKMAARGIQTLRRAKLLDAAIER